MNIVVLTTMSVVLSIIVMILFIILFFKVWGMTNNIKRIVKFLEYQTPDIEWVDDLHSEDEEGYQPKE